MVVAYAWYYISVALSSLRLGQLRWRWRATALRVLSLSESVLPLRSLLVFHPTLFYSNLSFSSFLENQKRMDNAPPSPSSPQLDWSNVGFGFAFVAMNMVLSQMLQLQIGTSLVISALRCIVQLTFVAMILQSVFAAQNIWTVAAIARTSHTSTSIPVAHYLFGETPTFSAIEYAWHVRSWCVFISSTLPADYLPVPIWCNMQS